MRLIKIETKGFKSFADKTTLHFDGGVVGIVGPNGSGKSNINDAIKWVLGEQSIKSLRGDNSNDVIFSGSKTLREADQAEVSLTFDNSEKRVSIPHTKIVITRLIKRNEGSSNYYINGELARLKDVKAIAMESGIGKSSLAIISQGTISDIAEASPEERRFIFEEAAGISKYKQRKKEALRKLDSTTEVLEKVKTVTKELEKQVAPLKRQAEKAKLYLGKKDELKDVEIALIAKDITFFTKKFEELSEELEDVISTKETLKKRVDGIDSNIKEKSSFKYKLENEIQKLSTELEAVSENLRDLNSKNDKSSHQRQLILDGQIQSTDEDKLKAMEEELQNLALKINQYNKWQVKSVEDVKIKKQQTDDIRSNRSKIDYDVDHFKNKLMKVRTKLAMLIDYRDNKSNLFKGTKTILENKNIFPGIIGMVADIMEVDIEHKSAIESLLASSLQNVVVENSDTAVSAIKFLNQNKGGRATFIPLNILRPKGIFQEHYSIIQNIDGFLGTAADLVKTKPKFEILKKFLMGNVIVAQSIESANKISKTLNNKYMVVTLNGDIVRVGGILSGGEKQKSKELLGFDDKINRLEKSIPLIEEQIKLKNNEMSRISNTISENNAIVAELQIESAKVREKKSVLEHKFDSLKITYQSQTKKEFKADSSLDLGESLQDLESNKSSLSTLIKAKRESIIFQNNDLSNLIIQKTEFEKTLRDIIESSSEKMTEKSQAEFVIKQAKTRLAEEYEMTIELAIEFSLKIEEEQARETVRKLRSEIKELGFVNIDAIEQFKEVNERYNKYKTSEEELFSAQQIITSAINEMDKIIVTRLDETVKGVNDEFNNVFTKMFGGGFAEIKYTNPNNLLETGIDVIAQPPGKTVKNLKLFSGGEKAMIAISLLFAVLKSKPLPLCILDEVEAPLDDANVVRFATYLQELKAQTQFMVITHRIGTMSRVDNIFGATMQKRGSTSFFTVKLEDAKRLID